LVGHLFTLPISSSFFCTGCGARAGAPPRLHLLRRAFSSRSTVQNNLELPIAPERFLHSLLFEHSSPLSVIRSDAQWWTSSKNAPSRLACTGGTSPMLSTTIDRSCLPAAHLRRPQTRVLGAVAQPFLLTCETFPAHFFFPPLFRTPPSVGGFSPLGCFVRRIGRADRARGTPVPLTPGVWGFHTIWPRMSQTISQRETDCVSSDFPPAFCHSSVSPVFSRTMFGR